MRLNSLFTLLIFASFIGSCENKSTSKSNKKKIEQIKKNDIQVNDKISDSINFETQTSSEKKPNYNLPKKSRTKKSIVQKVVSDSIEEQSIKIPEKWKNTYSSNPKWMSLYSTSLTSFLKGWEKEFESNSSSRVSREELLQAYRSRMENIFYETPSFIEFCVQEMKLSTEFEEFCQKWKNHIP